MAALRHRNFLRYFVGQSASALGNAMVPVALAFAVLRLTRSASDLGFVLASSAVSQLLFLLAGGVIADRVPRRLALLGSDATRFAAEGVLAGALLAGRPSVFVIAVLVFIQGGASALFEPASQGIVPSLVDDADLHSANSLLQTTSSAARVVGPALAGILVVTSSPGWAIAGDALSYGVSVITLISLDLPIIERARPQRFIADLREGWSAFRSRDWYWKAVLVATFANMLIALYTVLGPVAALRFYSGARTWAAIATATGIGSVVGGLVSAKLRVQHPLRVGVPLVVLFAFIPFSIGVGMPIVLVLSFAALGGVGITIFSILFQTTVQRHIPEEVLSRVLAYDLFGSNFAYPIGLALAAPLAGTVGIRPVLAVAGVLLALAILGTAAIPSVWRLGLVPDEPGAVSEG